ncbi:MAG TPA: AcvB/VirJ family lysyl-phosphatidylglycerol hydrolase [Longimicrobiaceae bacterium]|nr:AcvB/VirJ family lysyl-phosphatidylglycerol hydrolase [Longimicrobiaceae bacterium]
MLRALLHRLRLALWPRTPRHRARRLRRLPLVEERARRPGRTFAFVFTGDGNWAMLVRSMSRLLAKDGVSSVGLKARTYLLRHRGPDEIARDVEAVLRYYLRAWKQERVVLIGLSRGADLLPFVVRRLPADLRRRVALVALFSPARATNFRFRWADLFGYHARPDDVPLFPELQALEGVPVLCVCGTRDPAALCPALPPGLAECVAVDAGHNLNRDYQLCVRLILELIQPRE